MNLLRRIHGEEWSSRASELNTECAGKNSPETVETCMKLTSDNAIISGFKCVFLQYKTGSDFVTKDSCDF